jgi:hypothetical protein
MVLVNDGSFARKEIATSISEPSSDVGFDVAMKSLAVERSKDGAT